MAEITLTVLPGPAVAVSVEATPRLAEHLADTVDAHDASAISSVPAGGLAATTVQAALNELDTEKATATSVSDHLADATAAHAASAVSFTPVGTVAATDVQAAIAEVASEKALLAHASQHAGAGSDPITSLGAVSFTGGISLTGTASGADRKISMQGVQVVYLPDQAAFTGCLYLGNGGGSLAAGATGILGIGPLAVTGNTTGTNNVGIGYATLGNVTTTSGNTGVGSLVAPGASGSSNSGLGYASLYELTTGSSNVAVGKDAGRGITTGSGNTVLGAGITGLASGAANLTLVGCTAGVNNTGTAVAAVGTAAAYGNTAGNVSVLGQESAVSNTGVDLTAVGTAAAYGNSGSWVTAVGAVAGYLNTYNSVVLLGRSAIATGHYQFVVGSASYFQTQWVPGHDPDTYFQMGAVANTIGIVTGGTQRFAVDSVVHIIGSATRLRWGHADQIQTTVGAAGGASALPATPTKYLKVQGSDGTEYVIPAYAAA